MPPWIANLFKPLLADVRSAVVSMLVTGGVLIGGPVLATIWKIYSREPVPWTVFIFVVCGGIILLFAAIHLIKTKWPVLTEERRHQLQESRRKALSEPSTPTFTPPTTAQPSEISAVIAETVALLEKTNAHPLHAIRKAGAANLRSNDEVIEVNRQIAGRNYSAPFSDPIEERDYLKFLQFSVDRKLSLANEVEIYEATKEFYMRPLESVADPQVAAYKERLANLLDKKERIKDMPDSPGFDMGQARRRNQSQINEVREAIKHLEGEE